MIDSNESPLLFDTGRGLSCSWKGRQLYHPDKPIEQACNRSKSFTPGEQEILFLPSPLLWYGVEDLLEKLPDSSMLIAVEAEPSLYRLSREKIPRTLEHDRRISFLSSGEVDGFLKSLDASGYRRSRMLTLNGGYTLNRALYSRIFESVMGSIQRFWQNRMTFAYLGPLWLKNLFANCGRLGRSGASYVTVDTITSTKPVFIIGAGPSLDDIVPLIKEYRSNVTLLSVDTALGSLSAHGIMPDFAIAQDGQFHTLGDFACAPEMLSLPVFFDITSTKSLPRHLKGEILPFFSRFDPSALARRLEQTISSLTVLPPLGSVGITALDIASLLNPPEIWIAGIDFSYHLGKSHAKGSPYHQRELYQRSRINPEGGFSTTLKRNPHPLKDVHSLIPRIYTDPVLSSYYDTFSNRLMPQVRGDLTDHHGAPQLIHSLRYPLSSPEQLTRLLRKAGTDYAASGTGSSLEDKKSPTPSSLPRKLTGNLFLRFLEQERELLKRYLSGESDLIAEIDYTYRFFPDFHRFDPEHPEPGFLKRISASARQIQGQIEDALTRRHF